MAAGITGILRSADKGNSFPCAKTACAAVALVIVGALTVVVAYAFHIDVLIWLKPGLTGMSLVTAIGLILLGAAILLRHLGYGIPACLIAWSVIGCGISILVLHAVYGADVMSLHLDAALGYASNAPPQVSMATAVCLSAVGIGVLLAAHAVLADLVALVVIIVTGFALLGYAYSVDELYALSVFRNMALHTAASLLVLSIASVLLRPQSDWCSVIGARTEAGTVTRRQLAFMLVPVVGGSVLVRMITIGAMGPATALALLVAVTVIALTLLILRDGRRSVEVGEANDAKLLVTETLNAQMSERLRAQELENDRRNVEQAHAQAALFRAQRLEALSRLTGSIAHDFNNLLQAIAGSLDLLSRRISQGKPVTPLIDRAKAAVRRGAQLGNQLLAFSKTQKLDVRPQPVDCLIGLTQPVLASALGPGIELHYDSQAPGHWISTDKDQFSLALLNLALNARDAMRSGGRMTVTTMVQSNSFPSLPDSRGVSIQISDSGEGMTPEVLSRATEPFFSTKQEGSATGLGLAQVSSLVRQCDGYLGLRSEPGHGTTVEMVFPVRAASDLAARQSAVDRQSPPRPAPLILVIEDDEAVREVLVGGLNDLGYGVVEACDGTSGIALLGTMKPSAAVIDYLMPGMNGAEVAHRARLDRPDLPIVFVSGHFDTAALDEFTNASILRKPFELGDLQASLLAVLE